MLGLEINNLNLSTAQVLGLEINNLNLSTVQVLGLEINNLNLHHPGPRLRNQQS